METNPANPKPEWLKLAVVAVVAVGLAAVGWSISDNFQAAPAGSPIGSAEATTSTSSVPFVASSPTTTAFVAAAPTGSTVLASPASLELSQTQIDFGDASDAVDVEILNEGQGGTAWSVETTGSGLVVIPSNGELGPGASITVEVALDRSQIPEGEFSAELAVVWAEGRVDVQVSAFHNDNPLIHNPSATPATVVVAATGQACSPTLTTVRARVRDTSDIEEVVVRWDNGRGIVETGMDLSGEDMYEAQIGPFSATGSVAAKVVAFDVFGNAGGASTTITVNPCP